MEKYKISLQDLDDYYQRKKLNKVDLIWCDIYIQLSQDARREVKYKHFELTKEGDKYFITVPDGSYQVRKELKKIDNEVLLVKD
jgi:hypothetical protein